MRRGDGQDRPRIGRKLGTYGLLSALSLKLGTMLVPTHQEEAEIRAEVGAAGAIDGDSGDRGGGRVSERTQCPSPVPEQH
jgi:hypothetical protein